MAGNLNLELAFGTFVSVAEAKDPGLAPRVQEIYKVLKAHVGLVTPVPKDWKPAMAGMLRARANAGGLRLRTAADGRFIGLRKPTPKAKTKK